MRVSSGLVGCGKLSVGGVKCCCQDSLPGKQMYEGVENIITCLKA